MDEFVEFTHKMVTYSRYWRRHPVGRGTHRGMIIFGHSNMVHLEVVLRNVLSMVSGHWELVVITAKHLLVDTLQLCLFLDENIQVITKDEFFKENDCLNLNIYHQELSNIHFWIQFGWEKFVVLHPNCLLIHPQISKFLDRYEVLNSHFSFLLPKLLDDIGDGGLIMRSLNSVKSQTDRMRNHRVIPRSIDNFMNIHSLNCLPEFYLYEKEVDRQCLYLLARSSIQLSSLWVHCPWKLGDNWQNYLARILTPKFNVVNEPSLVLFSSNSPDHLGLVNLSAPPKEFPKFPWFGIISLDEKNPTRQVTLQIDPNSLTTCLGLYSTVKLNNGVSQALNWVTVSKIPSPKEIIHQDDYSKQLVYSNLNYYLEQYHLEGVPFKRLNMGNIFNKRRLSIFDLRRGTDNVDVAESKSDAILIVNDFQQLNDNLRLRPLLFVLPYRCNVKERVKSIISISKYNYFGYYHHTPCLFMGPYSNQTMSQLHRAIVDQHSSQKTPYYLKQKEEQIVHGHLPDKIIEIIQSGSNVITNNPMISEYFDGKVFMVQDFLSKRKRYSNQTWTDTMYFIKNNLALEHKVQIILSVVEMLLKRRQPEISPVMSESGLSKETLLTEQPKNGVGANRDRSQALSLYRPKRGPGNRNGLYAQISQTRVAPTRVVRRSDQLAPPRINAVRNSIKRPSLSYLAPVSYHMNSQSVSNPKEKMASSLRFGGFNDKVTTSIPLVGKRHSRVSVSSYQTISNTRW
jgi:hypothetical protein